MTNNIVELAAYFSQPWNDACSMSISDVQSVYESSAFKNWQKTKEKETELLVSIASRIDNVVKGLNGLAEVVARKG